MKAVGIVTLIVMTAALAAPAGESRSAAPSAAEIAEAKLQAAKKAAEDRWKDVREVAAVASPRLAALLPGRDVFRVAVFNPRSVIAGRPTFLHTLVMAADGNVFIESDADAAALLTKLATKPNTNDDAMNLAMAFGDLRHYPIAQKSDTRVLPDKEDDKYWKTVMEIAEGVGWNLSCTFLTDPTAVICQRYDIRVTRTGAVTVKAGEVVGRRFGYR